METVNRASFRAWWSFVLLLGTSLAFPAVAQPPAPADGTVLDEEPCAPLPAHADLDEFGRWYFDAKSWEQIRQDGGVACRHLHYASGGLAVEGYLLFPTEATATPRPAILYNRGGTGEYGKIDRLLLAEMHLLAQEGFVVAATNYRFVGALARRDEWGGADLDDVLNLIPLLRARPDVDGRNLFMMGLSRGGLMTYLALKRDAPVNAAAVIAGLTDMTRAIVDRSDLLLSSDTYDGWASALPGYAKNSREVLESRSPVFWADQIRKPVLILHSRTDPKVPVFEALAMAQKLQEAGREYELIIYDHDGHSLPLHRQDRNQRILDWFRGHMAK